MDNIPSLVSDMDDMEVESIWGKDHYRMDQKPFAIASTNAVLSAVIGRSALG